jgi:hypothetical protein
MTFGDEGGSEVGFETIRARGWPSITQYSIFLENRVGQLLELVRHFQGSKVKIVGLSIADTADCCIVRIILSHPEQGREILELADLPFVENELLVAQLTIGSQSLVDLCSALLQAELNIHYAYPLLVAPQGRPAIAMHVDDFEQASIILREQGFEILCEADLSG